MKIYHLKTCDSCRKAVKALRAAGHAPELIDVRLDGVDKATLEKFEASLGYTALVNKDYRRRKNRASRARRRLHSCSKIQL